MSNSPVFNNSTMCPCGSQKNYAFCCASLHGGLPAPDAVALMRSRYSAYVLGLQDYIKSSWHSSTYIAADTDTASTRWLGLQVKRHEQLDATHALVEFVARYKVGGKASRLHEVSRFVFENGRWWYLDGEYPDVK